jgi:hypothetical protein
MPPKNSNSNSNSNLTPAGKKTANVSPAYAKIIEEFRSDKPVPKVRAKTLDQYYKDWNERAKKLDADDDRDPEEKIRELMKNVQPKKDIGFTLGPAMSEEQFRAYRESSGPRFSDLYNDYHSHVNASANANASTNATTN